MSHFAILRISIQDGFIYLETLSAYPYLKRDRISRRHMHRLAKARHILYVSVGHLAALIIVVAQM
jgi:hypothetical protein